MNSSEEIRKHLPCIAVVGSGVWGINHVRTWHAMGNLAMVCDANPERLADIQKEYKNVETASNIDLVLKRPDIAAVVIATPAPTHSALVLKAIQAGKDVLVEKPMALNSSEGERMLDAANQAKRILMVGHVLEYHPAIVDIKKLIESGFLGKVQYIYSHRLNFGRIRTEENALWSFAPHDVAVLLRLMQTLPDSLTCSGSASLNQNIADNTVTVMNFPSGLQAHIFVSWLHPFKVHRLVIVGDHQMAVFDDTRPWLEKLLLYPHQVDWIDGRIPMARKAEGVPVKLMEIEPLRAECEHFLDCIKTRKKPLTDGESGIRVLRILEAAQESMQDHGRPVFFDASSIHASKLNYFAHATAVIDPGVEIGDGTKVWHFSHVMNQAKIGRNCIIGQNCLIGPHAILGDGVKIQNNVSVYQGVELEDYVFCGPSMVFTNVMNPRSEIERKQEFRKTLVKRGATLGGNCTVVCGVTIGRYAFIAAGATVTHDVPDYALMVGVPAVRKAWMSRHGHRLPEPDGKGMMICPESGWRYREVKPGVLQCLDFPEDRPLKTVENSPARQNART